MIIIVKLRKNQDIDIFLFILFNCKFFFKARFYLHISSPFIIILVIPSSHRVVYQIISIYIFRYHSILLIMNMTISSCFSLFLLLTLYLATLLLCYFISKKIYYHKSSPMLQLQNKQFEDSR